MSFSDGMYWNGMMGWGWTLFHGVFTLLLLIVGILAAVALVRFISGGRDHPPSPDRRSRALDFLEERYAKGEIDREEYLQKKGDIGG
ncbi:SHOCT domain-containing protein [Ancylobacter sp. VNQ12]|uniref:SHOCT domain-containing protein n=1 Tax=Xanthobacteraceae TaxID=335928 RepID=UPI003729B052